jgi:hypothetical protein
MMLNFADFVDFYNQIIHFPFGQSFIEIPKVLLLACCWLNANFTIIGLFILTLKMFYSISTYNFGYFTQVLAF